MSVSAIISWSFVSLAQVHAAFDILYAIPVMQDTGVDSALAHWAPGSANAPQSQSAGQSSSLQPLDSPSLTQLRQKTCVTPGISEQTKDRGQMGTQGSG